MAITTDDFNKIWASTSPLTPYSFSASQYKEGWNFIGSTPPSRQMWDFLQKNNDEKMQYLLNHFDNYLPLSGGTLTGVVNGVTPTAGDNSTKIATTEFVNAKAGNYLPLTGGSITGDVDITGDLSVSGAITGNVTGNVTGTATRAIKDGNGKNIASTYLPAVVGAVVAFAGSTTPQGWLLCDGSAVSRTDYAALFAVIGTTYGAGNGSSTFNLPNLVDKFIEGSATAGTVKSAGLPNITGGDVSTQVQDNPAGTQGLWTRGGSGALYAGGGWGRTGSLDNYVAHQTYTSNVSFDASRSNSIYGNSTTVQPPALTMRYIIKY